MELRVFVLFGLLHFTQAKILDLSCSQIRDFVDGHNSRRLKLAKGEIPGQPAAAEMKYIVWDEELAVKASAWASNNKFSHNPDRNDIAGRFGTGENLFWIGSTDLNLQLKIDTACASWFDEYKQYTYGPLKISDFSDPKKQIGHYTQMAWSNSVYVGCGVSEYIEGNMKKYLVVCNYGPTGNYLGQTPYKSGNGSGVLLCATKNCKQAYGNQC